MTDQERRSQQEVVVTPTVSIVVATYNRLDRLRRTILMLRENVSISRELVVVGGASADGTREWLERQPDVRFLPETSRQGAVRAYNRGFRSARGRYVLYLNDDSHPLPGSVEAAVDMIERPDLRDVGLVAFYFTNDETRNVLDEVERDGVLYRIYNVRGTPYANFGLIRRDLLEELGYYDERYVTFATDPDLAMKVVREAGLEVLGCRQALIDHEEFIDDRKSEDLESTFSEDNRRFREKWGFPEKFTYQDPRPAYLEMLRRRGLF